MFTPTVIYQRYDYFYSAADFLTVRLHIDLMRTSSGLCLL